jgi:acetate kinase
MASLPVLVLNSGSSSIKFSLYEAGNGERTRLFEGAVDGIGTDLGKFWIKDAGDKKLVDQTPPVRSLPRQRSGTARCAEGPRCARTSASHRH